jgi:TonB family protein
MSGDEKQASGSDCQDNYEATVLDFLDRQMAAIQVTQDAKEQPDELDVLVSDLLKQVMTESDQPQSGQKVDSEEMDSPLIESTSPEKETSSSKNNDVLPDPESEPVRFESRDAMLAEFMAIQEKAPTSENSLASLGAAFEFSQFENSDALIAEFMPSQEAIPDAGYKDVTLDSGPDTSQFEGMDAVLAEYMPPQEEALPAETNIAPPNPESESVKSENVHIPPADPASPQGMASTPANRATSLNPDPVSRSAENLHVKASAKTPETKRPAIPKFPSGKAPSSQTPSRTAASVASRPIFAAQAAPKSKTLLIAAACVCILAVVAVPGYYFSGPSGKAPKSSELRPSGATPLSSAASKASPNHEVPAVLISQVSPKYPELAAKNRASASVVLDLSIDCNGNVVKATPVSGPELFHKEAIRAAMQWRYKPASTAGSNVPVKSRVTFNFSAKN